MIINSLRKLGHNFKNINSTDRQCVHCKQIERNTGSIKKPVYIYKNKGLWSKTKKLCKNY